MWLVRTDGEIATWLAELSGVADAGNPGIHLAAASKPWLGSVHPDEQIAANEVGEGVGLRPLRALSRSLLPGLDFIGRRTMSGFFADSASDPPTG